MNERRGRAPARRRMAPAKDWPMRMRRAADLLDATASIGELTLFERAAVLHAGPFAAPLAGCQAFFTARAVGLFAGSFNPLTHAHVALAEAARQAGGLDVIAWTLAVVTVDKERVERATLPDRLAQLAAYCDDRVGDALVVVNRGLYVEQARALHALMRPDARLAIVVGYDKVVQIFDPRYYDDRDVALGELFAEADVLVAPRAGQGPEELQRLLARPENTRYAASVRPVPLAPQYAAESSTQVRTLAARVPKVMTPRALVTAEGWALARLGAYVAGDAPLAGAYAVREAWEQELPGLPAHVVQELPPLSALVAQTQAPSGGALRAWLESRGAGRDALMELLR